MGKSFVRFLIVLSIAALLGTSLYLAMHYVVQPYVDRVNPEAPQEKSGQLTPRPIQLPNFEEFVRGASSIARNVIVFAVVTIVVWAVQTVMPKRRTKPEPEE